MLLYMVFSLQHAQQFLLQSSPKMVCLLKTWIKLYLEYKYLNPQKRYFKVSKRNVKIAAERNMMNEKRKVRKTKSVSGVAKTN
jgi:hypothetical protein